MCEKFKLLEGGKIVKHHMIMYYRLILRRIGQYIYVIARSVTKLKQYLVSVIYNVE